MTSYSRTIGLATVLALAAATPAAAQDAISDGTVKIGVLTDLNGPNSDVTGPGSVQAARMAAEDFGGTVLGKPIEVVSADHQNKADLAAVLARQWYENDKVDMITDVVVHGLPVMNVAKQMNKIALVTSSGNTRMTNEDCNEVSVQWVFDTDALSSIVARELVRQGHNSWFFLTADYVFGHSLERSAGEVVRDMGGTVVGAVKHPYLSPDVSSYLLRAQGSGAKVIGLANASGDTRLAIKQANEFGITPNQLVAALLLFITDVHSLGLPVTQGTYLTEGFYWDLDDETRAWSKRFFDKMQRMPSMLHAGVYSAVTHYLRAIAATRTDETKAVMQHIRQTPVRDFFARNGQVREDGRMVHDMYLMQVKKPAESKAPWDYYHVRKVVPAAEAFPPLSKSTCPLVKR